MQAEMLRPFIAARAERVSTKRTDVADVARILADGAYGAAAHTLVEDRISAGIAPDSLDRDLVAGLQHAETELLGAGYRPNPDRVRHSFGRGNRYAELADIGRELDSAYAGVNTRSALVDAAVARWYAENAPTIQRIAREEAISLLHQRGHAIGRSYSDVFGEGD